MVRTCLLAGSFFACFTGLALADHQATRSYGHHHHHHSNNILGLALKAVPYLIGATHHHHSYRYSYGYSPYSIGYSPSYAGYPSYYSRANCSSSYARYGNYYAPSLGYSSYSLPPVYYPAELSYGPQALMQFMGIDRNLGLNSYGGLSTVPATESPVEREFRARPSNLETMRRAYKFVEFGDRLFKEGRYHEALQQYKTATSVAPDLGEAYFRQGQSLIGTSRYDLAAAAFKRGILASPEFATADFRLDSIYGDARLAKSTHLEGVASTAIERPEDSDLLFLIGLMLHFDGSRERAQKFFKRAAALSTSGDAHIRPFLTDAAPTSVGETDGLGI